jgi:hypothetical protein
MRFLILLFIFGFNNAVAQVQPVVLQCVNTQSNGDVELSWQPVTAGCGIFMSQDVYYSLGPLGPFSLLVSLTTPGVSSYVHVGANGIFTTYYYYIENNYNCVGLSLTPSATIDNLYPATPLINYVSVTATNLVQLSWQQSSSPETFGYIVYYLNGAVATPIDTVFGANNTNYIDAGADLNAENSYTIAAIDSCEETGLFSTTPQHNIVLQQLNTNCNTNIDLTWQPYDNWQAGVQYYQVFASVNSGPYSVVFTSVDANASAFTFSTANDGDNLCFYVNAVSNDGISASQSNRLCFVLNAVQSPAYVYLQNISVALDNSVDATWSYDLTGEVKTFNFNYGTGSLIQVPQTLPLANPNTVNLPLARADEAAVEVQLTAIDSCDVVNNGFQGKTVFVKGEVYENYTIKINWTLFELSNCTVSSYDLYRETDGNIVLLGNFAPTVFYYLDQNAYTSSSNDSVTYWVIANYTGAFADGSVKSLNSYSNRASFAFSTRIIVPNTFAPLGVNNEFLPYLLFADLATYQFSIMNRWGAVVFESDNAKRGWDGYYRTEIAPQGVYTWVVTVTGIDGRSYTKKGTVLLLR